MLYRLFQSKHTYVAIICGTILTTFFFWNVVTHLFDPVGHHTDATYQYLLFYNNVTKIANGDFANLFNTQMFYPLKTTLAFGNSLLGPSVLGLPIYLVTHDAIATANSVLLINFFLAFMAMYLLAYRWTKVIGGSLVAAIIFAFNPYIMARALSHELSPIQWIPYTFLTLELVLEKVTWRRSVLFVSSLFALFSSFYWIFSLVLFIVVYVTLRKGRGAIKLIKPQLLISILFIVPTMVWYLTPYMRVMKEYGVIRPLAYTKLLSLTRVDFLLAGEGSVLYHNLKSSTFINPYISNFVREHPAEHTLFLGFTAYLLAIVGIASYTVKLFDSKSRANVKVLLVLAIVAIVLMLGPYIRLGNVELPGPYLLLRQLIPFTSALRVPTRFVVIVIFAVAGVSAMVVHMIKNKLGNKVGYVFAGILFCTLIIEYRYSFPAAYTIPNEVNSYTSWLSGQQDIHVIVSLPIGNGNTIRHPTLDREFQVDGQYALYGIYHKKLMVNGYNSFIPPQAYAIGRMLTVELQNPETIQKLRDMGVDAIVVHRDEFLDPRWATKSIEYLRTTHSLLQLYQTENITAFSL